MREFEKSTGRTSIGNRAASGTEIIKELGVEHVRTGSPIVYTSADSVFQIAAHEQVIPIPELYRMCEIAREILRGPYEVGRVIARPFTGEAGAFTRTANRHDYAVPPPANMLLDQLHSAGRPIYSVGKIFDVFLGRGIGEHVKTKNNADGMTKTIGAMEAATQGLIYVNLVDFDQLYGHRNDIEGYASALEEFDGWLPEFEGKMDEGDLAIITADHGCDPHHPVDGIIPVSMSRCLPMGQKPRVVSRWACELRCQTSGRPWPKISVVIWRKGPVFYQQYYEKTSNGRQLEDVQNGRGNRSFF
jgi:phosphopentomutase